MNTFIKKAYDLGVQEALSDFGLSGSSEKTASGDLSPLQVGIASGGMSLLLPGAGIISAPTLAALASPQDRALSRFGHTLGGGLGGSFLGAGLGAGAGVGVNALVNALRGEDLDDNKTRAALIGAGLGGLLGSAAGAGAGQHFSQSRDFPHQVVR